MSWFSKDFWDMSYPPPVPPSPREPIVFYADDDLMTRVEKILDYMGLKHRADKVDIINLYRALQAYERLDKKDIINLYRALQAYERLDKKATGGSDSTPTQK